MRLLGVTLKHVDRVNGWCPEVPETKCGVVRGGYNKLLHGMCADMSQLSVMAWQDRKGEVHGFNSLQTRSLVVWGHTELTCQGVYDRAALGIPQLGRVIPRACNQLMPITEPVTSYHGT